MEGQNIVFRQGDEVTGDSGERGNLLTSDGGFQSIKPYSNGEQAVASVFNRSIENVRRRTEVLRTSGENDLFRIDAGMRYLISSGTADGTGSTVPFIQNWALDDVGPPTRWIFELTAPIVLQPLNTPNTDVQEVAVYTFTVPVTGTVDLTCTRRAYTGANLIRVIWEEVDPAELTGAAVPNYCDVAITGDPVHILTIIVRNDATTTISQVITALATLSSELSDMGITAGYTGSNSAVIDLSSWDGSNPAIDYQFAGTFEREIHYITPTTFATFFSTNYGLADGDTLAIQFVDVDTRRKQHIGNPDPDPTTVTSSMLFISTDNAERIPNSIPLCKRIGDILYWVDGTVVVSTQAIMFGEHGHTVDRLVSGDIKYTSYSSSSPPSSDVLSIVGTPTLQEQMESTIDSVNRRVSLITDENVQSNRWSFLTGAAIPGSSSSSNYRLDLNTLIGDAGVYVANWFKNFGSIVETDDGVDACNVTAGYFEASSYQATTIENISSIKSKTNIYGNVNTANEVHANEFILDAYQAGNRDITSVYAALQTGNSLATFLGAASALKLDVNVDSATMGVSLSGIDANMNIQSTNSGATVGIRNLMTIAANCNYQAGIDTWLSSSDGVAASMYGHHAQVSINSGTTVTDACAGFHEITANAGSTTVNVYSTYQKLVNNSSINGLMAGTYTEFDIASYAELIKLVGSYVFIDNSISTLVDNAWGLGGMYIDILTTPLNEPPVGYYYPTGLFLCKGRVILQEGADAFNSGIELFSASINGAASATVDVDTDLSLLSFTAFKGASTNINFVSSDTIYGFNLELGGGFSNTNDVYFFNAELDANLSAGNFPTFGPKIQYSLYDDAAQHNVILNLRKADEGRNPLNGRIATINFQGKYDTGIDDWASGASICAYQTASVAGESLIESNLFLAAIRGKIELQVNNCNISVEGYHETQGGVLDLTECAFVSLPVDTNTSGFTGVPAGAMYCGLPTGIGGNVILYIFNGVNWKEIELT